MALAASLALAAALAGPLGPLPPQRLARGDCALFVWAKAQPAGPVLMVSGAKGRISVAGRLREVARREGPGAGGTQTFDGHGLALELALAPGLALADGAAVPDGLLSVIEPGGGMVIVPVSAVAACRR